MGFTSIDYLLFLPIVVALFYIVPRKLAVYLLAIASFAFCAAYDQYLGLITLAITVSAYFIGLIIGKHKGNKAIFAVCIAATLLPLLFFKFSGFSSSSMSLVIPIGISYYTLRIIDYYSSVFRGDGESERNFCRFFLLVFYFPMMVQGPIERSGSFLPQLSGRRHLSFEDFKKSVLQIISGYFMKLVIADRLAIFVNAVYRDASSASGIHLALAACLYSVQLYCDFAGYTNIAIGTAGLFGIRLSENFRAPFFSLSVTELWRNWHITLTDWLRNHIYFPLGGSQKGTARKYLNIMTVFLVSGLWHGSGITFVIWGIVNGLYQVAEALTSDFRENLNKTLRINQSSPVFKLLCRIRVFLLFSLVFIFFRASDIGEACTILARIFTMKSSADAVDLFTYGVSIKAFLAVIIALLPVVIDDVMKCKGTNLNDFILSKADIIQILSISLGITVILVFGVYGAGFEASSFIYAGF